MSPSIHKRGMRKMGVVDDTYTWTCRGSWRGMREKRSGRKWVVMVVLSPNNAIILAFIIKSWNRRGS
jgi:hypothetical protein